MVYIPVFFHKQPLSTTMRNIRIFNNNKTMLKLLNHGSHRVVFVGQNSGLHGINHLFKSNASLLSRCFWLLVIIASIGGLYLMMEPVVSTGMEINYTSDTLYLDWTTTFPGLTVCENQQSKMVARKLLDLYPDLAKPLVYGHRLYLSDLLYARGQCSNVQCNPCGTVIPCDIPWRQIIERIHKTCDEMLSDCSYNGDEFPCCDYYRRVDSEHGPCFSFNTLQHKKHNMSPFVVNRTSGPGVLKFRLLSDAEISIHSSEELSTNNLDVKLKNGIRVNSVNYVDWSIAVVEIENDVLLQSEHIHERGCRFLHEVPDMMLYTYPVYSYGACRLVEDTEETFAHCGCIHPVRDLSYEKYYCNFTGMNCWNTFEDRRLTHGVEKSQEKTECLVSCVESEITTVHFTSAALFRNVSQADECDQVEPLSSNRSSTLRWEPIVTDKPGTLVNVKMVSLPTLRYKRNLIRTHLDLVVAVGGIVGLFFSASILSFLEVFYLILRPQKFPTISNR